MEQPLVSVIVRAFNAEKFIVKAIDSIINQDYNGSIEIIICYDEGTTDKTLEKLDNYIRAINLRDNRELRIIKHTHTTPFRAMVEYGFSNARGAFIKPLDYDNYMPTNWISQAIKELLNKNASFGFSQAIMIDESGNVLGTLGVKPKNPYNVLELVKGQYIDINEMIFKRNCLEKIVRLLKHVKHRYYDALIDDWLYGLLALKICKPIFIDNLHIYYIIHAANVFGGVMDTFEKKMLRLEADLKSLLAYHKIAKETQDIIKSDDEEHVLRRSILLRLFFIASTIRREVKPSICDYVWVGSQITKGLLDRVLLGRLRGGRYKKT